MEAPVPQASRELAGRHCHSMGGGAYYCVDPCVCGDMACDGRIVASGNRLHRGRSHRSSPELRRADGRAGRSRVPTGRDAPGGGGANPTGAATPGGADSGNGRDRRRTRIGLSLRPSPERRRNRAATMPTLRGLRGATIRQGGNGSMRDLSLRPCLSPNYPVTFPARSWPRLPCRFTPQTASGF